MSDFNNFRFDPNNGVYFDLTIDELTKKVFLDITIFEDLAKKRNITSENIAYVMFHSLKSTIYRMCINAISENPSWPKDKALPLLKKHNR